jgi:mono/diheme cytochrome c family protein
MKFKTDTTRKQKFNVYDLFRDIEKLYGVLYMILLIFIIYLGSKYVRTLDYNKLFSAPELLAADTNMRAALPVKRGTLTPPVDVIKLTTPNPELIAKGKELFTTNCVSCHGETGQGNGPAGATLNPPPRNFVNPQLWRNGPKMANMYVTLQEGIPNSGMASFSNIPPEDRFAIIQYVHTFNPTFPKDSPDSLKILDERYGLSTGVKSPNQIPLSQALELTILEYDTLRNDLNTISWKIENNKNDSGTIVFNEIVSNKTKALNSLASNMKWNENSDEFVKFIETETIDKGFKASVYQLSPDKMNLLYEYLKNIFVKNKV